MWETRSKQELKDDIFAGLEALGADYAEASYAGGNDEGGIDDVAFYRHVGDERLELESSQVAFDSPVFLAFDQLLSLDFGSWAGEFSAYGTVFADLRQNRIWRTGSISTMKEDPDAGEY